MSITWTPWSGGECPVEEETLVVVELEIGGPYFGPAKNFIWHVSALPRITAYCVVTPYVEGSQTEYQRGYQAALADADAASKSRERVDALVSRKEQRERFDRYVCAVAQGVFASEGPTVGIISTAHALMTAADAKMKEVQA